MTIEMIFGAALLLLIGLAAKVGSSPENQAEYAVEPIPVKTNLPR
ncbi:MULTISPECIES: hypothetical protein [Desertifilum]|uniref:Uncharacterized protein n=1 Tax=Desertifilum tharense IPPAS B-1220 TaxID=1781255 RepID=A0ACD5GZ77_9CYAN|nr:MULTISPECIES: hypothetical protein [Desertifilum]MDA0213632.1 hypothetical protein [Cyanobacteria bacterium FC1]